MPEKPSYSAGDMLTVAEAAEYLGVHAATVRRWADGGDLPAYRTPTNHRRFKVADLDKAIAAEQQPATPKPETGENGSAA